MSIIDEDGADVSLIFDLHLPCAILEYEVIRQIHQTREIDNENVIDFA